MQIVWTTTVVARHEVFTSQDRHSSGSSPGTAGSPPRRTSWTCASGCSGAQNDRSRSFGARRADIERFGRHLEACGRAADPRPWPCEAQPFPKREDSFVPSLTDRTVRVMRPVNCENGLRKPGNQR